MQKCGSCSWKILISTDPTQGTYDSYVTEKHTERYREREREREKKRERERESERRSGAVSGMALPGTKRGWNIGCDVCTKHVPYRYILT